MKNFDLTKYLAEGKLHEELDPQDVVDIADTVAEEFTKESADKGDFMVYSVGELDSADMTFELDTDTTAQTPERILNMSNLGVGEGWGGSFRISPKEEGYEVRNAEKGGLVAIIDNMGNFKMLSADESRAEMGRTKGEETDYMQRRRETDDYMQEGEEEVKEIKSNKMKKSELKEMIKAAMMAETSVEETLVDALSIREEEEDVEDVEIDTEEEVDVDVDMDMDSEPEGIDVKQDAEAELGGNVGDVQDNLEAALMAARELGDEKLEDQIGNTLTFFTRQHVVKENLNESTFPIWNKIK